MNPRRIVVLLGKEIAHTSKGFVLFFAVIVPVVLTLVVSLLFGAVFSGKPRLGLVDEGSSALSRRAAELEGIAFQRLASDDELRRGVEQGAFDLGVVLPAGFDQQLKAGQPVEVAAYVWGESLLKHRAVLATTLVSLIREIAGQEVPVEVVTAALGEAASIPWEDRLLPFIVLMSIVLAGSMVPAASAVTEKQARTLWALAATPTTLGEVFLAKALLGGVLSWVMGGITLLMNRAWGGQPFLLLLVLGLSAAMAAIFGTLLGSLVESIDSLFATIKAIGLFLYAPALVYMFPVIPSWIGRLFPTYYMIQPIVAITQHGAGWPDVALDVFILVGLILALLVGAVLAVRRLGARER